VSGLLAGKVWHSNLDADLKPLAATLADIGDDDGLNIYPSVAYVAWRLGCGESTVRRGLSRLRDMGVLAIVSGGKGGRSNPTDYRLVEEKLPARETWKEYRERALRDRNPLNSRGFEEENPLNLEAKPSHLERKPSHLEAETLSPVRDKTLETSVKQPLEKQKVTKLFDMGPMPEWLSVRTWLAFVEMRRTIRKPMTEHAADLIIRRLAELKAEGYDPEEVLNQSIRNSWQDVFELRETRNGRQTTGEKRNEVTKSSLGKVFGITGDVACDIRPSVPAGDTRIGSTGLPGDAKKLLCRAN